MAQPVALSPADRVQLLDEMTRFVDAEAAAGIPVETVLLEGDVDKRILEQARVMTADLLALGTHGRSGFERLMLGSVTEKVLRKARCPVLSVPPRAGDAVPTAPLLFRRILCAVDFSDAALTALGHAISLSEMAGARLTVLHAMVYDTAESPGLYETLISDERLGITEFRGCCEAISRARLQEAIPKSALASDRVETLLADGKPYREILRAATDQQADLIVLGVHGRSAADRLFFGSTTQHVVRQATCPVLILRAT